MMYNPQMMQPGMGMQGQPGMGMQGQGTMMYPAMVLPSARFRLCALAS